MFRKRMFGYPISGNKDFDILCLENKDSGKCLMGIFRNHEFGYPKTNGLNAATLVVYDVMDGDIMYCNMQYHWLWNTVFDNICLDSQYHNMTNYEITCHMLRYSQSQVPIPHVQYEMLRYLEIQCHMLRYLEIVLYITTRDSGFRIQDIGTSVITTHDFVFHFFIYCISCHSKRICRDFVIPNVEYYIIAISDVKYCIIAISDLEYSHVLKDQI